MARRIAAAAVIWVSAIGWMLSACEAPSSSDRSSETPSAAPTGSGGDVAPHLQSDPPESPIPLPTATPAGY